MKPLQTSLHQYWLIISHPWNEELSQWSKRSIFALRNLSQKSRQINRNDLKVNFSSSSLSSNTVILCIHAEKDFWQWILCVVQRFRHLKKWCYIVEDALLLQIDVNVKSLAAGMTMSEILKTHKGKSFPTADQLTHLRSLVSLLFAQTLCSAKLFS